MKIPRTPHSWSVTPKQAVAIQRRLAASVVARGRPRRRDLIAGVDVAFSQDKRYCYAGVVVWERAADRVVEKHVTRQPVRFPYVPGLLSFREVPSVLVVLRRLRHEPDIFMTDGHGFAHPRRFGLACHLGVLLDRPTLGVAKSVLVGQAALPGWARASEAVLADGSETIGMAVRTQDGVRPVYVSVGHRVALAAAVEIVLSASTRFRLPEPTRLADQLVGRCKKADGP